MLRIWPWDGDPHDLSQALADGRVLAIPTESSYGLAVDPRSAAGVEAIYRIKERDRGKPLPVVASDVAQAIDLGIEPNEAGAADGGGAASFRRVGARGGGRADAGRAGAGS